MKISEYKGEDALDLLADILEPVSEIIGDKQFEILFRTKGVSREMIKHLIKNHKVAMIEIMARIENEPVDEFRKKVTVFTLPSKILELLSDTELMDFFVSQGLMMDSNSFGSAMENTEETEIM